MYRYVIIKPDGTLETELHKKAPDYREARKYVEGSIQIIPYFSSMEFDGRKLNRGTAYANENGYTEGKSYNLIASACWLKACPKGDPKRMVLLGTVLFVAKDKEPVSVETS
jgi:hypothetical protein